MKKFKWLVGACAAFALLCTSVPTNAQSLSPSTKWHWEKGTIVIDTPERPAGQQHAVGLTAPKLNVVRVGFVGLGMRGPGAVERFTHLDGVEIVALCDKVPAYVERAQRILAVNGLPAALEFTGEEDWRKVCELENVDLIYNCTDWEMHVPIALYAMERGRHVAVEVPAAMTVKDCWALVDAAERTQRHCMMLENCCYDFFEMATLNMARAGLFGEIVHVEGAYIHDLRALQFDRGDGYVGMWRLKHNTVHTGNPYPTHGLGPLCQLLDIHRGDRMERLVSMSSGQFGMSAYAARKYGPESPEAETPYALGDMNTTLIRTAKGKSILIQHDVTMSLRRGPTTATIRSPVRRALHKNIPSPRWLSTPMPTGRWQRIGWRSCCSAMNIRSHRRSERRPARWAVMAEWILSWITGSSTAGATGCRSTRMSMMPPSGRRSRR